MASEKVVVPDIGGSEGAEVIELLVAVGDEVSVDQGLIVLESDKASMEIPSTAAGKVTELFVAEGDQLVEGAPIAAIEVAAEGAAAPDSGSAAQPAQDEAQAADDAEPAAAGEIFSNKVCISIRSRPISREFGNKVSILIRNRQTKPKIQT